MSHMGRVGYVIQVGQVGSMVYIYELSGSCGVWIFYNLGRMDIPTTPPPALDRV